ncbi:MAG: glycosyltransferase [Acidobacteriaceae bacterium]
MKPACKRDVVYLYVWSGDAKRALDLAEQRYPGLAIEEFPHRRLREASLLGRITLLRAFRGRSVIFFVESVENFKYPRLIECIHLLHRCRETVLCDGNGQLASMRTGDVLRRLPGIGLGALLDAMALISWWCYLRMRLLFAAPVSAKAAGGNPEIGYLVPSLAGFGSSGGAISHIRGFLSGLRQSRRTCRVFTGVSLAQNVFENEIVPKGNRPHVFWEAAMLSYNTRFSRGVQMLLSGAAPWALYQRHCPFAIAGALLSQRLKVPLIVEYNGPLGWIADHWDPTPFRSWITLCEEVTLRCAARIIVVSEVLRTELIKRGIPPHRIRVNPNAVDPDFFRPGTGRKIVREKLGVSPEEVLIGFAGSFSLWHGIEILEQAIVRLLTYPRPCRLRFLLMGSGLLHGQMRTALAAYEAPAANKMDGAVVFTGPLPSEQIVGFLDACDILVSPHIPMPDGSPFFGSPTKLFEYMAMGKAIVASRLEQLAEVLEHDRTGWLVTPGEADELADAILRLALDPGKREKLGSAARQAALESHSWTRNVSWALSDLPAPAGGGVAIMSAANSSSPLQ